MESLFFPTFAGKLVAGVTIKQKFMQKNLVIVESPAKAKTIEKFLGKDYKVLSSYGHIRDLKKKEFSIDIDKEGKDIMIGFNPKFLMDALRVIDDENVTMYLVNHKSPCFIRDKEEKYIYLILPVNFTA